MRKRWFNYIPQIDCFITLNTIWTALENKGNCSYTYIIWLYSFTGFCATIKTGVELDYWSTCDAKGRCQKLLSGFFPLGGGVPSFPLSFFEHNDFPLRGGGGYPPIPLRKKSAKKQLFLAHFLRKFFGNFPWRGGDVPPLSAKVFLEKWFSVKG